MKEVNMGEPLPSPPGDEVDEQVVELVTHEGGVRKPDGGVAGKIATDLRLAPQTVSASLRRLEKAGHIAVTRNKAGNITAVVSVKAADPVATEAPRESESSSEQPAAEEVDPIVVAPQVEPAEVDRIASLLLEAQAEIADALSSHEGGHSCLTAVTSAIQSLVVVQSREAEEAAERERSRIFKSLGSISVAEVLKLIEREQ